MAKNLFGKLVALAVVAGAVAGGVSYYLQYKSFHKELDDDFHEFEDDFDEFDEKEDEEGTVSAPGKRTYVSLKQEKHEETAPEDTVCEDTPVEETPAEEAPAEEAPAEEAPAEEAPVEAVAE